MSVSTMRRNGLRCGPLAITLAAQNAALEAKALETLNLYNVRWDRAELPITIQLTAADAPAAMVRGSYLTCARMHADTLAGGIYATCLSGASARYARSARHWDITVPAGPQHEPIPEDVEDLVNLVLSTGWREAGWVPLHAGAVVRGTSCALLTAPTGGGKTTLTAALIRRQWQTLGDDKILLRLRSDGTPEIAALVHNFNLHPGTRRWFPEVGELERLPRYSAWTEKRKVHVDSIWPGATSFGGSPTHVVQINRPADVTGIQVAALDAADVLSVLLHQTVIPNDRPTARQILNTVATTAPRLTGLRVDVGADAYDDPSCLAALESALEQRQSGSPREGSK